jgi:hypothetical protein
LKNIEEYFPLEARFRPSEIGRFSLRVNSKEAKDVFEKRLFLYIPSFGRKSKNHILPCLPEYEEYFLLCGVIDYLSFIDQDCDCEIYFHNKRLPTGIISLSELSSKTLWSTVLLIICRLLIRIVIS